MTKEKKKKILAILKLLWSTGPDKVIDNDFTINVTYEHWVTERGWKITIVICCSKKKEHLIITVFLPQVHIKHM